MIADDGDIIRGLGYVTLYSAYLEEAIDEVVEALIAHSVPADRHLVRAPASRKIRFCRDAVARLISSNEEMAHLDQALDYASQLLEERNVVVHGRIYANFGAPDVRRSGRPGVLDQEATAGELYNLANKLCDATGPLMHGAMFSIHRAFTKP
jgi:hypothetical protein